MGDEREGRGRSLMGAGPLLGQLHSLPSVEAKRGESNRCTEKAAVGHLYANEQTSDSILQSLSCVFIDKHVYAVDHSPCVGVEAVKGQTGSKE